MTANMASMARLPGWLPDAAHLYLWHTEAGISLRALARRRGCHPSTVMRQVRRFENRRDDPLVDEGLARIGREAGPWPPGAVASPPPPPPPPPPATGTGCHHSGKDVLDMTAGFASTTPPARGNAAETPCTAADTQAEAHLAREARRVLRRLAEAGTLLLAAPGMERALVMKQMPDGQSARIAVMDRETAQAFALKEWIALRKGGRVAAYAITPTGRAALRRLLAEQGRAAADGPDVGKPGGRPADQPFADQHRVWGRRDVPDEDGRPRPVACNLAESPVTLLARRRDRDGRPFLAPELVAAAERLREDFELAQIGPRVAQNWDRFLTGGDRGSFGGGGPAEGPRAARDRVAAALRELGPGLGDVALRCCCFLEGLEATERRMGWSARSGKVVLRIALTRLRRHYDTLGDGPRLIG